jgi:hypothetical protein
MWPCNLKTLNWCSCSVVRCSLHGTVLIYLGISSIVEMENVVLQYDGGSMLVTVPMPPDCP